MLRKAIFFFSLALLFSLSARAQDSDKIELFGGYSYQWVNAPHTHSFGQSGWEASAQYKLNSFLGLVADFDGHYGQVNGANSAVYTYLFGPQISFGKMLDFPSRISPFGQFLVGGGHVHFTGNATDGGLAWTVGFGVDYRVMNGVYWRVLQVGYQPTYFFGHKDDNSRLSTGLVVHF